MGQAGSARAGGPTPRRSGGVGAAGSALGPLLALGRWVSARHLLHEPLRTAAVLFGICLGVAVFVSIRVANVSALEAFRATFRVLSGPANLTVRPTNGRLPDTLFARIWRLPGVEAAAPRVEATLPLARGASARHGAGTSPGVLLLGIDPFTQAGLAAVSGLPGAGEDWVSAGPADARFLTQRNAVLVTDRLARHHRLRAGSRLRVLVSGAPRELEVLGVLPPGDLSRAFGGDVALMDIANAQELLGKVGWLDRIDLHTRPEDERRVVEAVRKLLPRGVTVSPPSSRLEQAESMIAAFQLNLTALSLISALVGVFIIYNALLIAVLRRRREIATLRSLGVTRRGIALQFLAEAALLGLLGSGLGVLLGIWLARFTLGAVAGTIDTLYLQVRARELVVTPETVALGIAVGLGSALVAGLAPALEAAATAPAETLRERTAARPARRRAVPWLLAGLALLAFALVASLAPGLREERLMGFAGALALLLGVALCTPALLLLLGRPTQALCRRLFGVEGELAVHEVRAALDRSAAVVSALSVAVAMLIGLALMVGSFRRTVVAWMDQVVQADLYVSPAGQNVAGEEAVLPPPVVALLRRLPGVEAVDTLRTRSLQLGGRPVVLSAPEVTVLARYSRRVFLGSERSDPLKAIAGRREAVISESLARRTGLGVGDRLPLETPAGTVLFPIRGVFFDYTSDAGVVLIDRSVYASLWKDASVNNAALFLEPGVSPARLRDELSLRLQGRYDLQIANNRELRRGVLRIFDQTFAITFALQVIAVVVAMLGIGNALLAILLQREREIGILRAIGAQRGQVVRVSVLEGAVLAVWGDLIGSASGIALALHLVYVINRQFFGWTLQYHLTPGPFVLSSVSVLGAGVLAAALPAYRASRVRVAEAVRAE